MLMLSKLDYKQLKTCFKKNKSGVLRKYLQKLSPLVIESESKTFLDGDRSLLHYLCMVDLVYEKELLAYDINKADELGQTPMHICCRFNSINAANFLIKAGIDLDIEDKLGRNYLHYACRNNSFEVMKILLESGIDPSVSDNFGDIPLHYAALNGNLELIALLISYCNNCLELKNWLDKTPIELLSNNPNIANILFLQKFGYHDTNIGAKGGEML
jgi:ankyrin repeat protein